MSEPGNVQNIRDLLVVAMAPDLQRWGYDNGLTLNIPEAREIVAFVLDHTTGKSFELLAKLRAEQTAEEKHP